jgi:hypothetical protein
MRLSLYGKDLASEENLSRVNQAATERGHEVIFAKGNEVDPDNLLSPRPTALLTGLSSVPGHTAELSLGISAVGRRIPWFVLADTHRSWARPWAKDRVGNASVIGFHDAYYLGGPPSWRDFLSLQSVLLERKTPDEKLILVAASKEAHVADHIAQEVIAACREVFGDQWKFIFKPHPKERPETADSARRDAILKDAPILATDAPTNRLIASVDCSIFNPGAVGTTVASLLRRPNICFRDEVTNRNLRELTGSEEWYPADHGACISANATNIREALLKACSADGARELSEKQVEVYPVGSLDSSRPESRLLDFLEARV